MVGIVTDSASALEPGVLSRERVHVVPLLLEWDGQSVEETSLPESEISELLASGRARTASPPPGSFLRAIEAADDGDGVVVLTVASRFSSSSEAARLAASQSGTNVEVVDTNAAAGAEALVVLSTAAAARTGLGIDALAKHAGEVSRRVRLLAEVGDLTQLARSGRLPRPLASLGNSVGVRPVFELRNGHIRLLRPGLSKSGALNLMLETWRRSKVQDHRLHLVAMHGGDRARAEEILQSVSGEVAPATSFISRFGPAMVAHTGGDIDGLAWWWEPVSGRLEDGGSR
jgi:DegV family protein with EDD domain